MKPVPVRACELAAQRALQVLIVDGQRSLVENTELIEQLFGLPRQ